jgi:hypothetical protein
LPILGRYVNGVALKYLALLIFVFFSFSSDAIEVSDFKSGLMCGINKDESGWVCFQQENIHVTGQSSCVVNGETQKCTWYGFSFNYKGAKKNDIIECKVTYSEFVRDANISYLATTDQKTIEFQFTVDADNNYFVNPQYAVLSLRGTTISSDTICHSNEKELFKYKLNTIYPKR